VPEFQARDRETPAALMPPTLGPLHLCVACCLFSTKLTEAPGFLNGWPWLTRLTRQASEFAALCRRGTSPGGRADNVV
jgi:hypothetical protein